MKTRITAYATGALFIAIGLWGILTATDSDPLGWAVWFGGAAVVHDGVLVPCVLLVGALTTRLPLSYRRRVQVVLMTGAVVTLVALPFVLGLGRRADNPSILPLPYGRNLLIVLAVIATAALIRRRWFHWSRPGKRADGRK
jgi:hypothetical protein